jgi:hypothetical protein
LHRPVGFSDEFFDGLHFFRVLPFAFADEFFLRFGKFLIGHRTRTFAFACMQEYNQQYDEYGLDFHEALI